MHSSESPADSPAPPIGYILVDKPAGPSSHAAVQRVRRSLGIGGRRGSKAGHAGTLDPFASGLLVVLIGRATRLMPHVVGHDKRYLVDVTFGASSTTDDREGDLTPSDAPLPSRAAIEAALAELARTTEQVPPAVSAIHVDGVRAYQRVRRGETIDVPARPVRFDSIDLLDFDGQVATLDVRCATGTYMRALARDLGVGVGCPAYCSELRRTHVGAWSVDDAVRPDDVTWTHLRDSLDLVEGCQRVELGPDQLADVAAGRRLPASLVDGNVATASEPMAVALVAPDGRLAALAELTSDGTLLQPRTVFVDPPADNVQGSSA